jgi:hypothetical protein
VGTMGERNGVPTFDMIENPAKKDAVLEQKAAFEQQKLEATQTINQQKIEQQIQKMQLDAVQFQMKAQQDQIGAQEKFKQQQLNNFNSAYLSHLNKLNSIKPPKKDEISGAMVGESVETQRQRLEDGFKKIYGKLMVEVAPDIAADYGLEVPQQEAAISDQSQAALASGMSRQEVRSGGQQQADPRIERARGAAEAALLDPTTSPSQKADAQQLLDELKQRGL